jgi:hypothetical protein
MGRVQRLTEWGHASPREQLKAARVQTLSHECTTYTGRKIWT